MENNKNKDLLIGAVITDAEHRFTRRGDPFGTITIEDYNDSYQIFLWRENYLKYKHFVTPGAFVAISGKIEVPVRRKDLEFTVNNIELIQNLKEKRAKKLDLSIDMKSLSHVMISDLNTLFESNVGSCPVHFTVHDKLEEMTVKMPSKTLKVDLNNDLFKELKKYDLQFKIK